MRRFTALQILVLAFGFGLVFAGIFLNQIVHAWDYYRYPNAVYWHGIRVVPGANQQIIASGADMIVLKIVDRPMARLTVFLRPDDGLRPQAMVRDLCRRDGCTQSSIAGITADRAVATYRINGESMQIALMRLGGSAVWAEYKGPPEGLSGFDRLIESLSAQLLARRDGTSD
jgi:hypothetical protein